jgi:cephalosporin-C deacetylase-like acetyl esterase
MSLYRHPRTFFKRQFKSRRAIAKFLLPAALAAVPLAAQEISQDAVLSWMNGIAQQQLLQRAGVIDNIHTTAEADARKQIVHRKLLDILGGLPNYHGPLNARVTGQIHNHSYTIEKVIYESLPGFYVTANVYRPNLPGRYPAILLQSGHTQEGKPENQRLAANLALKGFVVLCSDPIGQGERVQTYSRQLDGPLSGWSVPEHIGMGAQAQLIGEGLARYFISDAMRSLDYLQRRPDVDGSRMGAAGCSGGGALTTFTGGLDPRLKVVVPACYPSSFKVLFPTSGPDAEMVFPHLLASGLDTADFVELSAPTPWLLQATETDEYYFSHEGVHMVYEESQKWHALYNSKNNLGFMVGPGSHGMPLASREAVYQWMIRWLKNGKGDYHEQPVTMYSNNDLLVTKTGNVEDEPGSRKLYQLLLADYQAKKREGTIAELEAELKELKISTDHSAPAVKIVAEENADGCKRQHISFETQPGIWLDGMLYIPPSSGRKPAVIILKGDNAFGLMPVTKMAQEIAKQGQVVLEMETRNSSLMKKDERPFTGAWNTDMQANMIGLNMPALRAHDILRSIDLLSARSDVDQGSIRAAARGVSGIWLLLAAASDSRIQKIWLDRTPYSLHSALENSLATDLWDAVIPGFVLHWDLDHLVKAMESRQVMRTDPTNWVNRVLALGPPFEYRYVLGDTTDLAEAQDLAYIHELIH